MINTLIDVNIEIATIIDKLESLTMRDVSKFDKLIGNIHIYGVNSHMCQHINSLRKLHRDFSKHVIETTKERNDDTKV